MFDTWVAGWLADSRVTDGNSTIAPIQLEINAITALSFTTNAESSNCSGARLLDARAIYIT